MATIPSFKESQRLAPSNPTGFQSSSAARIGGSALAGFGRGVSAVGSKLHQLEQRQARAEKTLAQADFKQAMTRKLEAS